MEALMKADKIAVMENKNVESESEENTDIDDDMAEDSGI